MAKKYAVGIDIGATNIKIGLIDKKGSIINKYVMPTEKYKTKQDLIDAVITKIEGILTDNGFKKKELLGIGIGVPGLVDNKRGIIHYLVNIKGWKNVELKKIVEKKISLPTFVDNDVNLMTLGEFTYGAGTGVKNMVCLTLGTGVGGGIIVDGKIYRGATLSAGEIGHVPINEKGPVCNCGGSGCLERYIGNKDLVKYAKSKIKRQRKTIIIKLAGNKLSKITPEVLSRAAMLGDKLAIEIWKDAGFHLGVALAGVVNFFNPELIAIGGGVANAGKVLFDSVRKTVRERAMKLPASKVRIIRAKLGEDAGLIGAGVLVMRQVNG